MTDPIKLLTAVALVAVAGCSRMADQAIPSVERTLPNASRVDYHDVAIPSQPRFVLERVQVFEDGLAYDDKRGVYILREPATGREWVGISGIGISELGSHHSGKTTKEDER